MSLPSDLAKMLAEAGLEPGYVEDLVRAAVEEDLAGGVDLTSEATVLGDQQTTGDLVARAGGVVAGLAVAEATFVSTSDGPLDVARTVADGDMVTAGTVLMTLTGPTRALLLAERTALNLLCHLSGIATATRRWADALAGTHAVVRDTRKTTPLLRPLEKYAVRCGGGENHRMSLSDAALIKDNHVMAAGGITSAYQAVTKAYPDVPVEIEVDSVEDAVEAAAAGAQLILLDNFTPPEAAQAVQAVGGRSKLEVSGGLTIYAARAYGETGVDYLAVGAITHSAPVLDIAFDLREVR
ncbi:MAG TPA: carboxylating nicotinate-nucleotide diphosphorylase [Jiangellaceae bacterium]|nr:carboxylating nicotinate-nucleotide diphosphorylase [Jiangellaceae bacterium]